MRERVANASPPCNRFEKQKTLRPKLERPVNFRWLELLSYVDWRRRDFPKSASTPVPRSTMVPGSGVAVVLPTKLPSAVNSVISEKSALKLNWMPFGRIVSVKFALFGTPGVHGSPVIGVRKLS